MGLFQRFGDIVSANLNDMIDRFEDPEKMLKQAVREMEAAIGDAKRETVQAMASEKLAAKELADGERQGREWGQRAEQAVRAGDDALAHKALTRKQEYDKASAALSDQAAAASEASQTLRRQLEAMQAKLAEATQRLGTLVARQKAAAVLAKFQSGVAIVEMNSAALEVVGLNGTVAGLEKRRKKKRSLLLLLVAIGSGLLLLLCAGGATAVWWFSSGAGAEIGADDDLRFMPDNCKMIFQVRVDPLLTSDAFNRLKSEVPQAYTTFTAAGEQDSGMPLSRVDKILAGSGGPVQDILVITAKQTLKLEDVQAVLKKMAPGAAVQDSQVGRFTTYEAGPRAFALVDDRRLVFGDVQTLRRALQRDKAPDLTPELQAAMKRADFTATIAVAMDVKSMRGHLDAFGGPLVPPGLDKNFDKIDGMAGTIRVNSDMVVTATALCQDPKAAEDFRKTSEETLATARQNKKLPRNSPTSSKSAAPPFPGPT